MPVNFADPLNKEGLTVLSLFDGMSCGAIALHEEGIKVRHYFASEIDRHAIRQTSHNFPSIVQLGSVTEVSASDLPPVDLLIGGSPCQGFSFAGKQLNFNDPRSALFFEYVRILQEIREYNPGVKFLLENVVMRKEYENVISDRLGLFPVMINSALVSAQNRERLYWTNIRTRSVETLFDTAVYTDIPLPTDKGLYLCDILDEDVPPDYFLTPEQIRRLDEIRESMEDTDDEPDCGGASLFEEDVGVDTLDEAIARSRAESEADDSVRIISGTIVSKKFGGGIRPIKSGKAGCLLASAKIGGCGQDVCVFVKGDETAVRRLTAAEYCRLQTIPEWYEWVCDESKMCKMLGNGWTVDVIRHIFKFLKS